MTQQGPNPIELYEGAVNYMQPILAGVTPNQLSNATTCIEWNVQQLITHNIKVVAFALGMLQENITVNPEDVSGDLPAEGAANGFVAGTNRVLDFLKSNDLSKVIDTPFGPMPLGQVILFPTLDLTVHKWDLAKGTNQDTSIDSGLAQVCYGVAEAAAEGLRANAAQGLPSFGPEVSVPISASIQDKLLAMSGRKP